MPIKLTNEIETSIVTAYQQGARTEDIQARFGVTRASIYNVLKRNGLKPDRIGKRRKTSLPISQKGLKRLADWWQEHKEQEHKEQEHKEQEHKEQEHKEHKEHKEQEHTVYHRLGIIAYRHLKGE